MISKPDKIWYREDEVRFICGLAPDVRKKYIEALLLRKDFKEFLLHKIIPVGK